MAKSVLIVGAGVIGLACARALSHVGYDVIIAEQHGRIGTEVSGRNSGVIHAGIYYPTGSAKARLCVRGKTLLYDYCANRGVAHRNTQKLIVATNAEQDAVLARIQSNSVQNGVPLDLISGRAAIDLEPALFATSALVSPTTGIVDVNGLMYALLADAEAHGAVLSTNTQIDRVFETQNAVQVIGTSGGDPVDLVVDRVVNAAGLGALSLAHSYLSAAPPQPNRFAKGNYFSIGGPLPFERLIYPVPETHGLGIHYTLDMNGQSRLGPNVRWVEQISYDVDQDHEIAFRDAVRPYWPGVDDRTLSPNYVGFRPKIDGGDFVIKRDGNIVSLLGIESPGLTSSLAVAEAVETLLAEA
jgi:L-2-hydroxyglutarate oxidase LhgO